MVSLGAWLKEQSQKELSGKSNKVVSVATKGKRKKSLGAWLKEQNEKEKAGAPKVVKIETTAQKGYVAIEDKQTIAPGVTVNRGVVAAGEPEYFKQKQSAGEWLREQNRLEQSHVVPKVVSVQEGRPYSPSPQPMSSAFTKSPQTTGATYPGKIYYTKDLKTGEVKEVGTKEYWQAKNSGAVSDVQKKDESQNKPELESYGLNAPESSLRDFAEKQNYQAEFRSGGFTVKAVGHQAAAFGAGVASGVVGFAKMLTPKGSLQLREGLWQTVRHPLKTGQQIGKGALRNPSFFIGEVLGSYGTSKLLFKGIQKAATKTKVTSTTDLTTQRDFLRAGKKTIASDKIPLFKQDVKVGNTKYLIGGKGRAASAIEGKTGMSRSYFDYTVTAPDKLKAKYVVIGQGELKMGKVKTTQRAMYTAADYRTPIRYEIHPSDLGYLNAPYTTPAEALRPIIRLQPGRVFEIKSVTKDALGGFEDRAALGLKTRQESFVGMSDVTPGKPFEPNIIGAGTSKQWLAGENTELWVTKSKAVSTSSGDFSKFFKSSEIPKPPKFTSSPPKSIPKPSGIIKNPSSKYQLVTEQVQVSESPRLPTGHAEQSAITQSIAKDFHVSLYPAIEKAPQMATPSLSSTKILTSGLLQTKPSTGIANGAASQSYSTPTTPLISGAVFNRGGGKLSDVTWRSTPLITPSPKTEPSPVLIPLPPKTTTKHSHRSSALSGLTPTKPPIIQPKPIVITKGKHRLKPGLINRIDYGQGQGSGSRGGVFGLGKPITGMKIRAGQSTGQSSIFDVGTMSAQQQRQATIQQLQYGGGGKGSEIPPPPIAPEFPPLLPPSEPVFWPKRKGKKATRRLRGVKTYSPSIVGVMRNIRSKNVPRFVTGLEVRPIKIGRTRA